MRLDLAACRVDTERRVVTREEGTLPLTAQEAALLAYLAARPHAVVPRDELLRAVWQARGAAGRAVDHAVKRLRRKIEADPGAPRHLLTARGEGYRFVPLPPRDAPAPRADAFYGRAAELARATAALGDAAVVTIVGPGGVGKTRLARQIAAAHAGDVVFCALADAWTAEDVGAVVARAIGAHSGDAAVVARALAARGQGPDGRALVVLDNAEQVVDALTALIPRWTTPSVPFLVTSRRPLDLPGERVVRLEPLSADDAAALFVDRAARAAPSVRCGREDVRAICALVDGLPLGIELAAAHVATLSPGALRERLLDRLEVLRTASDAPEERHRTLEAAIAWSWDLLDAEERAVLRRIAVFAGGFPVPAARAVAGPVADRVVRRLADRSLVGIVDGRGVLLGSVRAYALRQLTIAGDLADARDAHARWVLGVADATVHPVAGVVGEGDLARLRAERDNLRAVVDAGDAVPKARAALALAALARAEGAGRDEAAALGLPDDVVDALPRDLRVHWLVRRAAVAVRPVPARLADLDVAASLAPDGPDDGAIALVRAATVYPTSPLPETAALLDRAEAAFRAARDALAEATALHLRSRVLRQHWRLADGRAAIERAFGLLGRDALVLEGALRLSLADLTFQDGHPELSLVEADRVREIGVRLGDVGLASAGHTGLALGATNARDPDTAVAHGRAAVALTRRTGARPRLAGQLGNLGAVLREAGRTVDAVAALGEALAIFEADGALWHLAMVWDNLGTAWRDHGDLDRAEHAYRRAIAACEQAGVAGPSANCRVHLGAIAHLRGDPAAARAAYEAVLDGLPADWSDRAPVLGRLAAANAELGDPFEDLLVEARALADAQRDRPVLAALDVHEGHRSLVRGAVDIDAAAACVARARAPDGTIGRVLPPTASCWSEVRLAVRLLERRLPR